MAHRSGRKSGFLSDISDGAMFKSISVNHIPHRFGNFFFLFFVINYFWHTHIITRVYYLIHMCYNFLVQMC